MSVHALYSLCTSNELGAITAPKLNVFSDEYGMASVPCGCDSQNRGKYGFGIL